MRLQFHDAPISSSDPAKRLGDVGTAIRRSGDGHAARAKDEAPGERECMPQPRNLSQQVEDMDPALTGPGSNQKQGNPNGSRELVASFNTQGSRFNYFVGEPSPGTWTLMRRDSRDGNSKPAELVQTFSTGGGRYYYQIERTGNEARVYRSDRQLIDPNYKQAVGETAPSPATADRQLAELRADQTKDVIRAIGRAHKRFYAPGHRR